MKITITATKEFYEAPINGVMVPVRIWRGVTDGGVEIEAYVLSITPNDDLDVHRLKCELPEFMKPTREVYDIDTSKP